MPKKIRFPLDMGNGVEVRTLEELQENFSIEKVLGYYVDGKLITWLRDRYLDDIADAISELNKDDSDFIMKICIAFGVEYNEEVDMDALEERNRKLSLLKQYTDEKEYFDVVDNIAFNQDELYDLLDEDKHTIYLCGDKFSIPLGKRGIRYIGVNMPEVIISSNEKANFGEKEIYLENIRFDEKYQRIENYVSEDKVNEIIEAAKNCPLEDKELGFILRVNCSPLYDKFIENQDSIFYDDNTQETMRTHIGDIIKLSREAKFEDYQVIGYFMFPAIYRNITKAGISFREIVMEILLGK